MTFVGFWDGSGKWSKIEQILRFTWESGYTMPGLGILLYLDCSLGLHL